jgi:hypothetical protein
MRPLTVPAAPRAAARSVGAFAFLALIYGGVAVSVSASAS